MLQFSMQIELVQTETPDNLILSGLYSEGDKEKEAVILVHGFTSDFYSHKFFHTIQKTFHEKGIASVAIQNRGTGLYTEFLKKGRNDAVYIGSYYEKLEEAHLDITGWINFLKDKGYSKIVLAGHSLGTIKAVRYLFEGEHVDMVSRLILLAPFDKNSYLQKKSGDEWKKHVEIAKQKIAEGKEEETIPNTFDDFPMTYRTFYSWYLDSDLSNMFDFYRGDSYNFPTLNKIDIPVQIIVGDSDDFFYIEPFSTLESTKKILEENIKNLDLKIVEGSGHTFIGFEGVVGGLLK